MNVAIDNEMLQEKVLEAKAGSSYKALGVIAIIFGLITIKEGASVLFFNGTGRAAAGNYVPFVLVFNTIAGFIYIAAGVGVLRMKRWAGRVARVLAVATTLVIAALGIYVLQGGLYEARTVGAMVIRSGFWIAGALYLWRSPAFRCDCSGHHKIMEGKKV